MSVKKLRAFSYISWFTSW